MRKNLSIYSSPIRCYKLYILIRQESGSPCIQILDRENFAKHLLNKNYWQHVFYVSHKGHVYNLNIINKSIEQPSNPPPHPRPSLIPPTQPYTRVSTGKKA